ncbi:hypothetical protein PoB_007426200 [Plakobranchus ocellatus]|uniref:Uncharacterized protein n=1 Tax=Plakobranchus ocellatus TaxID=259542 RepID=A0AAV4DTT0_9GAST|nr:hypothetical protein PoB_007426200 [Plakobranchus ocellatus]
MPEHRARTCDRRLPADLRANLLSTVPPKPRIDSQHNNHSLVQLPPHMTCHIESYVAYIKVLKKKRKERNTKDIKISLHL